MCQFIFITLVKVLTVWSWLSKETLVKWILFSYRFEKTFRYPRIAQSSTLYFHFFKMKAVVVEGCVFIKKAPISAIGIFIFRQFIPINVCKPICERGDIIYTFVTKRKPRGFIWILALIKQQCENRSVRSETSEKSWLLAALPLLPSDPWPLMFRYPDLASTVLHARLRCNAMTNNFLRTASHAPLTFLNSINSEIAST